MQKWKMLYIKDVDMLNSCSICWICWWTPLKSSYTLTHVQKQIHHLAPHHQIHRGPEFQLPPLGLFYRSRGPRYQRLVLPSWCLSSAPRTPSARWCSRHGRGSFPSVSVVGKFRVPSSTQKESFKCLEDGDMLVCRRFCFLILFGNALERLQS